MKDPYELRVIADALIRQAEGPAKDAMTYAADTLREIATEVEADIARLVETPVEQPVVGAIDPSIAAKAEAITAATTENDQKQKADSAILALETPAVAEEKSPVAPAVVNQAPIPATSPSSQEAPAETPRENPTTGAVPAVAEVTEASSSSSAAFSAEPAPQESSPPVETPPEEQLSIPGVSP